MFAAAAAAAAQHDRRGTGSGKSRRGFHGGAAGFGFDAMML